jgi:hypothetical protein
MNDAMVENPMVLNEPTEPDYTGYHAQDIDSADDCDSAESAYLCRRCDCEKTGGEMSEIDGMCADCFADSIKKLNAYAQAQEDNAVVEVLNYLTNNL